MRFLKMHGLGNDFVILDHRNDTPKLTSEAARKISDRHKGVGCDQLIVMEATDKADFFMRIYNPDASEAGACGNATRCVADIYMKEQGIDACTVETLSGVLKVRRSGELIEVDMGEPKSGWQEIPLAEDRDTLFLDIPGIGKATLVNMGNPHCVFFESDIENFPVGEVGPRVENHALFPERTNVEFVQVLSPNKLRQRTWERGAGETLACGSGACAVAVAAIRRGGMLGRRIEVVLDGGSLHIEWRESDEHVLMTGPVAYVFEGDFKEV